MASSKKEYYFYEGRNGKLRGNNGPGILVVDGQYKFRIHKSNKDNTQYTMYCVQQGNPEFSCKAKAKVVRRDDQSFFLYHCDDFHNHLVNKAEITAEELKQRMGALVKENPVEPVGDAIKKVKLEAAEEFAEDEEYFKEVVEALGSYHGLESRLLRIREKIIGPLPKNRDWFDPRHFLKKIYGPNHKVEVMDSNKFPENWKEMIDKPNPNSNYKWNNLNDEVRAFEDHDEDDNLEHVDEHTVEEENEYREETNGNEDNIDQPEAPPKPSNRLPKRILAFSSKKLLNLFSQCERGSLDGTFKSCCKLWGQKFVWMLKYNGHWIPVIWGWLPDKSEISYKVIFVTLITKSIKTYSHFLQSNI